MKLATEKFRKAENFPVASLLMPVRARKPVLALYRFARSADEIADNPSVPDKERNAKLKALYQSLLAGHIPDIPYFARDYYRFTTQGAYNLKHGLALLSAFIQDTEKKKYDSWEETLSYCRRSAATIGRHVLEASGEFDADISASDSLCSVLQLINHLQDIKKDFNEDGRLYFDSSFFPTPSLLTENSESPEVTTGKLNVIKKLETMLVGSKPLLASIHSLRLRAEISVIYQVAETLLKKLKAGDILATRIELTKKEKSLILAKGTVRSIFIMPKFSGISSLVARRSRSSFLKPLLRLDRSRKKAMLCFYSFCRLIDDAADSAKNNEEALKGLKFWRDEISHIYSDEIMSIPAHPISRELALYVKKYSIEREHLDEMIEGQVMDIEGKMVRPSQEMLDTYCYRVASCVGLVSVNIFGYMPANRQRIENFAISLGKALQLINIIRDVRADAAIGRLYISQDILTETGFADVTPQQISADYDRYEIELESALNAMARLAEKYLRHAEKALPQEDAVNMNAALLMKKIYQKYLEKMKDYHFIFDREDISLTLKEKFIIFYEPARKI